VTDIVNHVAPSRERVAPIEQHPAAVGKRAQFLYVNAVPEPLPPPDGGSIAMTLKDEITHRVAAVLVPFDGIEHQPHRLW
jgi:hypothetical protein